VAGKTVSGNPVIQKYMAPGGQTFPVARRHGRTVECAPVISQGQGLRAQASVSVEELLQRVVVFGGGEKEGREGTQQMCPNFGVEKNVKQTVTVDRGAACKDSPVTHLSRNDLWIEIFRPLAPDPLVVRLTVPISRAQLDQK